MKNDFFNSPKGNILEKENDINKENININSFSPKKFINNNKNKDIDNNNAFLSNELMNNNINERETNEKTYSFKPKKEETPTFIKKEEKIFVSDFLLLNNNNIIKNDTNKNENMFSEILKTKIELNETIEEKQKKYLEEIDEKKRKKYIKDEMDKRCKNLRESIEMNRKKLLENIKKLTSEKK